VAPPAVHLTKNDEAGALKSLGHLNASVRRKAAITLGDSTLFGDGRASQALHACLEDSNPEVRRAAIKALVRLTPRGDRELIGAVCARLGDVDGTVRKAAIFSIQAAMPVPGDYFTVEMVLARSKAKLPEARVAAVQALGKVAERGDLRVIAILQGHVERGDLDMRSAAMQAFAKVADVTLASDRLLYCDKPLVRLAAMNALMQAVRRGESNAVVIAMEFTEDSDKDVKDVASAIVSRGSSVTIPEEGADVADVESFMITEQSSTALGLKV